VFQRTLLSKSASKVSETYSQQELEKVTTGLSCETQNSKFLLLLSTPDGRDFKCTYMTAKQLQRA
jgi:predicted nucleotide-binding protein